MAWRTSSGISRTNGGLALAGRHERAFAVGVDVAATPGWVIHRTEMFELIHFTATGRAGRARYRSCCSPRR